MLVSGTRAAGGEQGGRPHLLHLLPVPSSFLLVLLLNGVSLSEKGTVVSGDTLKPTCLVYIFEIHVKTNIIK